MTPSTLVAAELEGLAPFPLRRTRSGTVFEPPAPHGDPKPLRRLRSGSSPRADPPSVIAPSPRPSIGKVRRPPKPTTTKRPGKKDPLAKPATASQTGGLVGLVPKERQADTWDCGLACARMVLLALGCPSDECSLEWLRRRLASSEVWTIDLAYLLTEYGLMVEYLTRCADAVVSPTRSSMPFYAASLVDDCARVQALLARAECEDVRVRQARLSAAELWNVLLDEQQLVIALIDANALYGRESLSSGTGAATRSFAGHYVLLAGIDCASDSLVVKDPARPEETLHVPASQMELARQARGTDEDLLLVSLDQEVPSAPSATKTKIQVALEAVEASRSQRWPQ